MTQTPLCVALTGSTGFVGRHVLSSLLLAGYRVRALVRNPDRANTTDTKLHVIGGDLFNDTAINQLVTGADAVVHLVGIIMENGRQGQTFERVHTLGTQRLADAACRAGVKRWIHMSALGSRPDAKSRYHSTKWEAEQAIRDRGLDLTIFRPSIIHGPDGEFMQMIRGFWCNATPPFVPYFGREQTAGKLQPVWVQDVARCFTAAITLGRASGETYPLGGPDVLTWRQLYLMCKRFLPGARSKPVVGLPVRLARLIAHMPGAPFNQDQVTMSQEDSVCQTTKVQEHFGFELAAFEPIFAAYADQIQ